MRNAPRLATWLLVRFSSGPHNEAIAGDLMEQYAVRQSRLWYWRQVLSAIVADVLTTASAHPWRTMGAVAMGWVLYAAASIPATWLIRVSRPMTNQWMIAVGVDGLDRPGSAVWISLIPRTVIVTLVCVAIGWMVSRINRRSAPAAACALALTVFLFEYAMIAILFSTVPIPQMPASELIAPAAFVISRPLGVLLGGVLGARAVNPSVSPLA